MGQTTDSELKKLFPRYLRRGAIWIPILVGLVHQLVMYLAWVFGSTNPVWDSIPVFVTPPGYIRPLVTLEYQWWLVLTLTTFTLYLLIDYRRLPRVPRRASVPFYIYLLFLLIFVKPI